MSNSSPCPAGTPAEVADAFVSGLQTEYLVIESPPLIRHIGIEFRPDGLGAVMDVAATAVAGRVQDARNVVADIDGLVGALRSEPTRSPEGALRLVSDALTARVRAWRRPRVCAPGVRIRSSGR